MVPIAVDVDVDVDTRLGANESCHKLVTRASTKTIFCGMFLQQEGYQKVQTKMI